MVIKRRMGREVISFCFSPAEQTVESTLEARLYAPGSLLSAARGWRWPDGARGTLS